MCFKIISSCLLGCFKPSTKLPVRFKKKSSCKLIKLKTICNLIIVVLFLCELLFSSRVEQNAEHFPYTLGWLGKGKGGNCKKRVLMLGL